MSDFEQPYWNQYGQLIINALGLKKQGREFHGACPACRDGTDRFWISEFNGLVKTHCRKCGDWKAIHEQLHADGLWPSLQPIKDNVVSLNNAQDFPVQQGDTYDQRKGVDLYNAKIEGDTVVVPLYNFDREKVGHQTITPDGKKRFSKGIDLKQGVFAVCGHISGPMGYVTEGWATGASVAMATRAPVVVGLNTTMLPLVCEKLTEKFPDMEFVIAADADKAGREAAQKTKLRWVAPRKEGHDWNDVMLEEGPEAVFQALSKIPQRKTLFTMLDLIKVVTPQWLVEDTIPENSLGVLFGASGSYKTFVMIDIAMSIATGTRYHGLDVVSGLVGYITGEGALGFTRRTAGWARHKDVDITNIPFALSNHGITLTEDSMPQICAEFDDAVNKHGPMRLIVFDTVDRSIDGSEDETRDTKAYLDFCDELRERYQATVMMLAHTGHSAKDRVKGSTKWKDRMDISMQTRPVGANDLIIKCHKMKDAQPFDDRTFVRIPIEIITDDNEIADSLVLERVPDRDQEALTRDRINQTIVNEFVTKSVDGQMSRADLKTLVAMELDMSARNVDRYIKPLIDDLVFILANGTLHAGENIDVYSF